MGRGKLEELELSWVKAEDEELGKSKKPGPLKSSSSFSKKRLSALQKTWCFWLSSPQGMGLALKWG